MSLGQRYHCMIKAEAPHPCGNDGHQVPTTIRPVPDSHRASEFRTASPSGAHPGGGGGGSSGLFGGRLGLQSVGLAGLPVAGLEGAMDTSTRTGQLLEALGARTGSHRPVSLLPGERLQQMGNIYFIIIYIIYDYLYCLRKMYLFGHLYPRGCLS